MRTPSLAEVLHSQLQNIRLAILALDGEALARHAGFLHRCPRKLPMPELLLALVSLAAESFLTLARAARVIELTAHITYSKQALQQRLGPQIERFLAEVATTLFGQLPEARAYLRGVFQNFGRVLLHDSTVETLPQHLAPLFPGSRNQRQGFAALRVQFICDLLSSQVLHQSLSGFTRNDQAAAPDILEVLRPGDLVIRDLGYFVLRAFQWIAESGAFFVSRFRLGVGLWDARTGQPLNLVVVLRREGRLDGRVLVGSQKLRARLVAVPVPQAVADQRRRKAKQSRDRRHPPSAERLFLMGWTLLLTNVPTARLPAKAVCALYRLRWRIEMIFKAWKSHLGLRQFHCRSANVLRLSVMTKLLFCALVYRCCQSLQLLGDCQGRQVSLQRLARVMGLCACIVEAHLLGISPEEWLEHALSEVFYEKRTDRENFAQRFAELVAQ